MRKWATIWTNLGGFATEPTEEWVQGVLRGTNITWKLVYNLDDKVLIAHAPRWDAGKVVIVMRDERAP